MADRKHEELAADIDDASLAVDEIHVEDAETKEKLDDLRATLEHATDVIDQIDAENKKGSGGR